jgi:hypothetical protein
MTEFTAEEVCWLKGNLSGYMETRRRRTSTDISLDVTLVHSLLDTWVFLSTIGSLRMLIGIRRKPDLRVNWGAGKGNYYSMVIVVLINSVLTSLPMFMLSFLQIPVGIRQQLDFYRSRFFWQSDEQKKKYRLTK